MRLRNWKLRGLQKKCANAVSFVVDAIGDLKRANEEYQKEMDIIDGEIEELTDTHIAMYNAQKENEKLIENFENLLK